MSTNNLAAIAQAMTSTGIALSLSETVTLGEATLDAATLRTIDSHTSGLVTATAATTLTGTAASLVTAVTSTGISLSGNELVLVTDTGTITAAASGVAAAETYVGSYDLFSKDGGPITIPVGATVNITNTGQIFAADPTQQGVPQEQLIGTLMLRDASTTNLIKREDGLFRVDEKPLGTDFATGPEPVSLTPKALEGSSVNPMASMVKLIEQSRSFEHQIRMIKESKSNDESGASMMKVS